uniref:Uncharacterized protein n=1 Tax=Anguilla anguilla TaxID=7936 RepID=A0A0E9VP69_ANGAN
MAVWSSLTSSFTRYLARPFILFYVCYIYKNLSLLYLPSNSLDG